MKQRRPCSCRGVLLADPDDAAEVERAVREHRQSDQHTAWSTLEQLAGRHVAPQTMAGAHTITTLRTLAGLRKGG